MEDKDIERINPGGIRKNPILNLTLYLRGVAVNNSCVNTPECARLKWETHRGMEGGKKRDPTRKNLGGGNPRRYLPGEKKEEGKGWSEKKEIR